MPIVEAALGALLGALLNVLFDRLASAHVLSFFFRFTLDESLIEDLKGNLNAVGALLDDAENKEITNPNVKRWLVDLRCVFYDAEDILDQIVAMELRLSVKSGDPEDETQQQRPKSSWKNVVRSDSSSICCIQKFTSFSHRFEKAAEPKLKAIIRRLGKLATQSKILGLTPTATADPQSRGNFTRRVPQGPTALVEESEICGRDQEKERIIEMLVRQDAVAPGSKAVRVVAIVGMGGLGKSTLAQLAYNNDRVKRYFDLRAWVIVSNAAFDMVRMTKIIVQSISEERRCPDTDDLNLIQEELSRRLARKTCLLVLDDVWNENLEDWECFIKPFNGVAPGSRIVVTTRNAKVASIMGSSDIINLEPLSDEDSWILFSRYAFSNDPSNSKIVEIGKKIAGKCKGLPLALKTLGSMLSSIKEEEQWENVEGSSLWDLSRPAVDRILAPLRLSYQYLPPHLKRCFAYCSLFPKDFFFEKENLVLLWIGEGFVIQPTNGRCMEDEGADYFVELVARSFFTSHKKFYMGRYMEGYLMHDLLHDVAESISADFFKRLEGEKCADKMRSSTRHVSVTDDWVGEIQHFNTGLESIRSFIGIYKPRFAPRVPDFLHRLHSLHVLSLTGTDIACLPDTIGNLQLLRYLDLSDTRIEELPTTVCNLYNLHVLICNGCGELRRLPNDMWKLVSLCHLDLRDTDVRVMPLHICRMRNMQTLLFSGSGDSCRSPEGEFRGWKVLRGKLRLCYVKISGWQLSRNWSHHRHPVQHPDKILTGMVQFGDEFLGSDRTQFVELQLIFSEKINPDRQLNMLSNLKHPTSLTMLKVGNYEGTGFPSWMGDQSMANLVEVYLFGCGKCCLLPSVGQLPSLRRLRLVSLNKVTRVGAETYGYGGDPFRSLEELSFEYMSEWEEWVLPSGHGDNNDPDHRGVQFPSLKKLKLLNCPRFRGSLPSHPTSLEELTIDSCPAMEPFVFAEGYHYLLKELYINDLPKLMSFDGIGLQRLTSLGTLEIRDCLSLQSLSVQGLPNSLKSLHIENCPALRSLPEQGLPPSLVIRDCPALDSYDQGEVFF